MHRIRRGLLSLRLPTIRRRYSVEIKEEVRQGLRRNAVVALESTIITHGLPWPQNLETAESLEAIVLAKGAVPATVAILDGKLKIGLSSAELRRVATAKKAKKTSCRDLAAVLIESSADSEIVGATTVAGTLLACRLAGIHVFATGGIGGVHAGGENSMDISSDLIELGRSAGIAVVCAGCKSILDIGRTLEVLETQGVAVMGYQTEKLATFYSTSAELKPPLYANDSKFVADWIQRSIDLKLPGGALVAVPSPLEENDQNMIEAAVDQAKEEAKNILGPEATPFMLKRVAELTKGKSIEHNVALIQRNASVASEIALSMQPPEIVVMGASALDNIHGSETIQGGVARNIAQAATQAGGSVTFVSALDSNVAGADCSYCTFSKQADMPRLEQIDSFTEGTLTYNALLDDAVRSYLSKPHTGRKKLLILDADLPDSALDLIFHNLQHIDYLWLDPTTSEKAARLSRFWPYATLVAPNVAELEAMATSLGLSADSIEDLAQKFAIETQTTVVLTLGEAGGLYLVRPSFRTKIYTPTVSVDHPNTHLGAGDTLLGVTAAAWISLFRMAPERLHDALALGLEGARLSVQSPLSVHPAISSHWLRDRASSFHFI